MSVFAHIILTSSGCKSVYSINFSIEEYDDTNVKLTKDSETVVLDDSKTETVEDPNKRTPEEDQAYKKAVNQTTKTTKSGDKYYTIGAIEIPKINLSYGILNKTTDEILKLSPTKFWGPDPNKIGNLCIVGHNYRNTKFFSKVHSQPTDLRTLLMSTIRLSIPLEKL